MYGVASFWLGLRCIVLYCVALVCVGLFCVVLGRVVSSCLVMCCGGVYGLVFFWYCLT